MDFLGTAIALALLPMVDKWSTKKLMKVRHRIQCWPDSWFKRLLLAEVRADTDSEQAADRDCRL